MHFDFVFHFYKLFVLFISGGWTQLISKKGRKNRKKDEATNIERQTCIVKPVQNLQNNKPGKFFRTLVILYPTMSTFRALIFF